MSFIGLIRIPALERLLEVESYEAGMVQRLFAWSAVVTVLNQSDHKI
jgi:hypothetical protein